MRDIIISRSYNDLGLSGLVTFPAHQRATYITQGTLVDDSNTASYRPTYDILASRVGGGMTSLPVSALINRIRPNGIQRYGYRVETPIKVPLAYGSSQRHVLLTLLSHGSMPYAEPLPHNENQVDHITMEGAVYEADKLVQGFTVLTDTAPNPDVTYVNVKPVTYVTYNTLHEDSLALPDCTITLGASVRIDDIPAWALKFEGFKYYVPVANHRQWEVAYKNVDLNITEHGYTLSYEYTSTVILMNWTTHITRWGVTIERSVQPTSGWAGRNAHITIGNSYATTALQATSKMTWISLENKTNGTNTALHNDGKIRVSTTSGLTQFYPNVTLTAGVPAGLTRPIVALQKVAPSQYVTVTGAPNDLVRGMHKALTIESNRAAAVATQRAMANIRRTATFSNLGLDAAETAVEVDSAIKLFTSSPDIVSAVMQNSTAVRNTRQYFRLSHDDWHSFSAKQQADMFAVRARGVLGANMRDPQFQKGLSRIHTLSRGAASSFLAAGFGLLPIADLIVNAPEFTNFITSVRNIKTRKGVAYGSCYFNPGYGGNQYMTDPECVVRAKLEYHVDATSVFASLLPWADFGLFHLGSLLWNLTPFSWLMDIFDKRISLMIDQAESILDTVVYGVKAFTYSANVTTTFLPSFFSLVNLRAEAECTGNSYVRRVTTVTPLGDGRRPRGEVQGETSPLGLAFAGAFAFLQI